MGKVILLSPPYLDLYGKLSPAAGRYFPLGLGYIASYIRKYGGHEVLMFEPEAQGLSMEDIAAIIRRETPDVIGITSATPNWTRAIELARISRAHSRARIVMGGVHATALPDHIMTSHHDLIDAIVIGEGEQTMLDLIDAFGTGSDLSGIAGVMWHDGTTVRNNGCRQFIEDMDSIPYPARDLIDQSLFRPNLHNARHRACLSMLTSRGCPFECSFCAARLVSGKRYRMHSPQYVLEEMQMLKRDYGARQLLITDDTFTLNRPRLIEILEGMIRLRLDLEWFCFSHVNSVDRETLMLMRRAGCYSIGFGVESSDPAILARMGKKITPAQAVSTIHEANAIGMKTQAFYVFGSPGETIDQMRRTVEFSLRVNSTLVFYNMLVPYPGTRDFAHFFADTPPDQIDWDDFVAIGERCVLKNNPSATAHDIERLIGQASLAYYAHPRRLMNVLRHIRTPYELGNYLKGGLSFLRQIAGWMGRKK